MINSKKEVINILAFNLKDNVNAYKMNEDGTYTKIISTNETAFDVHKEFFDVTEKFFCNVSDFILSKKKTKKTILADA